MTTAEIDRAKGLLGHLVSEPEATTADFRRLYDEVLATFEPPDDARIETIEAGGVPAIRVAAPGATPEHVAVLVHGGGWCMGTAHGYREWAYRISRAAGCEVVVLDYRLAPEHPFPAAHDDVVAAYRWARAQDGVRAVALVGDSAGGGLVVCALAALRDAGDPAASASVVCSPLVDLAGESPSHVERAHLDPLPTTTLVAAMGGAYLAGRAPQDTPLASALHGDLGGLPPLRVLVGTDEGLHDDAVRLVERIHAAGGEAELEVGEGMMHIWPLFAFLPQARDATDRFGAYLAAGFSG